MKKTLVLLLAVFLTLTLLPATAMAAEHTFAYDSTKTAAQNGTALYNLITGKTEGITVADGDTIYLPAGEYAFDNTTNRALANLNKSVTLIGAGSGSDAATNTVITSSKYGFVIGHGFKDSRKTYTLKNMRISASWQAIYAKDNADVYLEDLVLETAGNSIILLDSSNTVEGSHINGVKTVVNATNVTFPTGKYIELNAKPCSSYTSYLDLTTYAEFNYSNCTGIDEKKIRPQYCSIGFGNLTVNGETINELTDPKDASAVIGETATFKVVAPFDEDHGWTYKWQVDDGSGFADIAGATSESYTTDATTEAMNGYRYRCIVNGAVESDAATLAVGTMPETGDADMPILYAALIAVAALTLLKKRALSK